MTPMRTKPDVIIPDVESNVFAFNSEYRAVAMYSEPEGQVIPKQLKQLPIVQ